LKAIEELRKILSEAQKSKDSTPAITLNEENAISGKIYQQDPIFDNAAKEPKPAIQEDIASLTADYLTRTKIPETSSIEANRWNDPLRRETNEKFVTMKEMNDHYGLFLQRIQKQMGTIGGGGEVKFRNLDDVDRSTIGPNKHLEYDPITNKFFFEDNIITVNKSAVVESNNTVVANSNTPTVITDMSMVLGAGQYLVTFNSEYTDTLGRVTATAAADLAILYDYLIELPATVTDHASAYGSGETLGPGVYTQAAASSIAGTLTLDAGGDPNALFVFRSAGALTTAASTNVVLINGATSKNIWWVSQGSISTGADSVIRGSLFTNQAAVSTGARTQIEGRMLAINGAAAVGDASIFTEPTGTSVAPLGSIALFSIFAAIGGISNTGESEIALSIGTNSGTITGFETATVSGEIYPGGIADLAVISYGIYVGGVLVADSARSQTHTTLVSGWPMSLQTIITLPSPQTVDVRTKAPIGEFSIGPGMSFVAIMTSDYVDSGGNVSASDRITSPNGSYSTIINNSGITTAPGNIVPLADNVHDLGSPDLRWQSVYVGPGSLYLDTAILTVEENSLKIQGVDRLDIQELRFFENTIESTEANTDIQIGLTTATADLKINRNTVLAAGKTFGLVDTVTEEIARLSVSDGVLQIDGANQLKVGQLKFVDNTIQSITANTDIQIGEVEDVADLVLNRNVVIAEGKTLTIPNSIIGPIQGIVFDTTHEHDSKDPGTLCWNSDDDTLNIQHTGGVIQQIGQELYARVSNATGSTITSGTVVRFDGAAVNGEAYLEVAPFQANGIYPSLYALGVATQDIADGAKGVVTTWGKVRDINTTGGAENWVLGDILYASPTTAGGLTKVKPTAPNNVVPVAAVLLVSATIGELFVRPTISQQESYGRFARTTTQTANTVNTGYPVVFDNTAISNGVVIGSPASQVVVSQSGFYQFDVSLEVEATSNKGVIYVWFRKNGNGVPLSSRSNTITNGDVFTISSTLQLSLAANDWIETVWAVSAAGIQLSANASPAVGPSVASALLSVGQIQL